jgi:uncharacterized membrane protein
MTETRPDDTEPLGIESTAQIKGHPIHPMLVPFPIASLIGVLLTDLAFWGTRSPFWAEAGMWLLGVAIVTGAAAAVAGLTDFFTQSRIMALSHAWQHMIGNVAVMLIAIVNFGIRLGMPDPVLPWGLLLSLVAVTVLAYTGWLGGELVYRYGIGMFGRGRGRHEP